MAQQDVTFSHSPSHLNCPFPTVSPEEMAFSNPICFELSSFASMVKAFTLIVSLSCEKLFLQRLWTPPTGP